MDRKMQKQSKKLRISVGGPMLLSTLGEVIGVYRISLMIPVTPNPNFKISRFRARRGNGGGGGENARGGRGGGSGIITGKGKDGKGKDGHGNECECERCFFYNLSVSFSLIRKSQKAMPSPFPGGWGDDSGIDYQTMEETFFPMDCKASSTTIDLAGAATPVSGAAEMMEEAERVPGEMERVLAEKSMAKGTVAGSEEDITDWNRCGLAVPSLIFFSLHARPPPPFQLP